MLRGILAFLIGVTAFVAQPVGAAPGDLTVETYRFIGKPGSIDLAIDTKSPAGDEAAFVMVAVYAQVGRWSFAVGGSFLEVPGGTGAQLPCDLPECRVQLEGSAGGARIRGAVPKSYVTEWVVAVRGVDTKVSMRTKGWTVRRNDVGVHHRVTMDQTGGVRVRVPGEDDAVEVFRGVPPVTTKRRSMAFAQLPCEDGGDGSANLVNRAIDFQAVLICLGKTWVAGAQDSPGPATWELNGQVLGGLTRTHVRLVVLDIP